MEFSAPVVAVQYIVVVYAACKMSIPFWVATLRRNICPSKNGKPRPKDSRMKNLLHSQPRTFPLLFLLVR